MENCSVLADSRGPARIIHVHGPSIGPRRMLVVDNVGTQGFF